MNGWIEEAAKQRKRAEQAESDLAEAVEALRVLAEMAAYVYKVRPQTSDDTSASGLPPRLTVGHCRHAAAIRAKHTKRNEIVLKTPINR